VKGTVSLDANHTYLGFSQTVKDSTGKVYTTFLNFTPPAPGKSSDFLFYTSVFAADTYPTHATVNFATKTNQGFSSANKDVKVP